MPGDKDPGVGVLGDKYPGVGFLCGDGVDMFLEG